MKNNQADELERFKREINLVEFAQSLGYEVIKKESSKASTVMRLGGDKIIVATDQADNHGIYFSTGDDTDNGSLIDFAQKRLGLTLGHVRKELRGWMPGTARPSPKRKAAEDRPERPQAVAKDQAGVMARWASMKPYTGSYLTGARCLDPEIIEAFKVRQDAHGNACIAHRDGSGVVGWESKNKGFSGFAAGGQRALSFARLDRDPLQKIVITESAIDAMSFAQMNHEPGTGYASTSGTQFSPEQRAQLTKILAMPGVSVVLAMDRDAAGDAMAHQVRQMAPPGASITREVPSTGKDWNDALRAANEPAKRINHGLTM